MNNSCGENGTCVNEVGSYRCTACASGYAVSDDQLSCKG